MCAQKLMGGPAESSARHRNEKSTEKLENKNRVMAQNKRAASERTNRIAATVRLGSLILVGEFVESVYQPLCQFVLYGSLSTEFPEIHSERRLDARLQLLPRDACTTHCIARKMPWLDVHPSVVSKWLHESNRF